MFELHAIQRACLRIPGSLKQVALVDPADLNTQPASNALQLSELDFLPGKSAYLFEKDLLTGRLEGDTDTGNVAGDYFTYRLTATVRAIRPTVESLRQKLLNRRIHVLATYQDDFKRLLPYMRLSAKDDSGNTWGDRQGYTFTGLTRMLAPGTMLGDISISDPSNMLPGTIIESATTSASTWSYEIPAGRLLVVVFVSSASDQTVSLGTTAGGEQLGGPLYVAGGTYGLLGSVNLRTITPVTIHLSGLAGTNTIEVWTLIKQ